MAMMQGSETVVFESDQKGQYESKTNFYSDITPEYRFLKKIQKFNSKKNLPADKDDLKEDLIGIIKDHPYLLEQQQIDGQMPLMFAFNQRNIALTTIFAEAEGAFFDENDESQKRLQAVLYQAVEAQEPDMVELLLKNKASVAFREDYDLLAQLIINCTSARLNRPKCCLMGRGINTKKEESSLQIGELLIKHGARSINAVRMAQAYNCRGRGCTFIRNVRTTSTTSVAAELHYS